MGSAENMRRAEIPAVEAGAGREADAGRETEVEAAEAEAEGR